MGSINPYNVDGWQHRNEWPGFRTGQYPPNRHAEHCAGVLLRTDETDSDDCITSVVFFCWECMTYWPFRPTRDITSRQQDAAAVESASRRWHAG